jgi:hypothetical protein
MQHAHQVLLFIRSTSRAPHDSPHVSCGDRAPVMARLRILSRKMAHAEVRRVGEWRFFPEPVHFICVIV